MQVETRQIDAPGCTLVPTMGALHAGHLALIRTAAQYGAPVVVTIFVNPTQFNDPADLDRYPRTLERDVELAADAGADVVFAPTEAVVYPDGVDLRTPPLPEAATRPGLEDAFRPGHFDGVVQVVARLFDLVQPRRAVFGEKDYQQLRVIQQMVVNAQQRWADLEIIPVPTVREPDGLAMSSRNQLMDPEDRDRALGLIRSLQSANAAQHPQTAESIMVETLRAHALEVDYAVIRDAQYLTPVGDFGRPTRALIAAHLGSVRLIDNMAMRVWR